MAVPAGDWSQSSGSQLAYQKKYRAVEFSLNGELLLSNMVWFRELVLRPTTGQVQHKAFFKVGPDAGLQPTHIRQNLKIPSAPSAFPQWGHLRRQQTKQQTIGELEKALVLIPRRTFHYCTMEGLISWLLLGWWFLCVYFYPYILNTLLQR